MIWPSSCLSFPPGPGPDHLFLPSLSVALICCCLWSVLVTPASPAHICSFLPQLSETSSASLTDCSHPGFLSHSAGDLSGVLLGTGCLLPCYIPCSTFECSQFGLIRVLRACIADETKLGTGMMGRAGEVAAKPGVTEFPGAPSSSKVPLRERSLFQEGGAIGF